MKKMIYIIIFVLIAIVISGVFYMHKHRTTSEKIISSLSSDSEKTRKWAKERLSKYKFTQADLDLIYEAAKKSYPDDSDKYNSTKYGLFQTLWSIHDKDTPRFIQEVYPNLPQNPEILFSCLRVLSEINTSESVQLLVKLLVENQPDLEHSYCTLFIPLESDTKNGRFLFPELFKLLKNDKYKYTIYCLAFQYCDEKAVEGTVFKDYRDQVVSDWNEAFTKRDKADNGSDDFDDINSLIAVIADFSFIFPLDAEIKSLLDKSLNDPLPKISLCSAKSLLRHGEKVSDERLEALAAIPETRLYLYEELENLKMAQRFPEKYHNQASFAEANMVTWLSSPFEFGRPPNKIELIATREIHRIGNEGRVYLFKYFYNDDDDGWMVGLSGPQPLEMNKMSTSGSLTFSHFNKLDAMIIDEHFASFL